MKAEKNRDRIREFFDLCNNDFNLRKYHEPVLVYDLKDDKIRYSLWEDELLQRFGLANVDGWDKTENMAFCPDWMLDEDEDDVEFEDDDDDLDSFLKDLDLDDIEV